MDDCAPTADAFLRRVGTPLPSIGGEISLASLLDLFGHKLKVLLQRIEAKDYRDIAALLRHGFTLDAGLGAAIALFPGLPPCEALKALAYFEGGDLADLAGDDRATLIAAARDLSTPHALPILSRRLAAE